MDNSRKKWLYFVLFKSDRTECWGRVCEISHKTHQDGISLHRIRLRHICTSGMKEFEGLEFIRDPRLMPHLFTIGCALLHGMQRTIINNGITAFVEVGTAGAILLIVLEITERAGAIDFRGDQRRINRNARLALVDRCFFSALDSPQNIDNPFVFIEIAKRIQQPPFFKPGCLVSKLKTSAGIVLSTNKFGVFCTHRLEMFLGKALATVIAIYEIVDLSIAVQFMKKIDGSVCIHYVYGSIY